MEVVGHIDILLLQHGHEDVGIRGHHVGAQSGPTYVKVVGLPKLEIIISQHQIQ